MTALSLKCIIRGRLDSEVILLGWWNRPLGQTKVGVVMNNDSLQMFSLKRYGFVPDSLLENKKDWTPNYHREEIGSRVLFILEDNDE